ncbi:FAD-binding domain-containing protein [Ophiobolus disseminans]|uniref:FAD-binding domain-containing protein n=1 Tax=Ophiobolus disseminans TaxID=1469910 RepID=A0A6A6ZLJ6_9PLEO|nr:FAD-binding domain-containing protein [Ophiobolus disseminans]
MSVFFDESANDVAAIIKCLKPFAESLKSKLSICGAGQQATPVVENAHGGLTIHLQDIQGVEVDTKRKIVSIAAGEKMGRVYEAATALKFGVAGNRHSSGGIGGDAVQVVLASGEIVNANAETNANLWAALKGGGSSFGIATPFDVRIFELNEMWGGKIFYFQPSFPAQIKRLVDYLHDPSPETNEPGDEHSHILCMNDISCTSPRKPKALEAFVDVQPQINQMNTLRVANLKDFTDEACSGASPNRVVKMTRTVKTDTSILEYAAKAFRESFKQLKHMNNILFSVTFEPIPISMIEQSNARGQNALGLKPSDGPLIQIDAEPEGKNVAASYRYLNYAFTYQDAIVSYGSDSKDRLRGVSATCDLDGFFQAVGADPFKLSK